MYLPSYLPIYPHCLKARFSKNRSWVQNRVCTVVVFLVSLLFHANNSVVIAGQLYSPTNKNGCHPPSIHTHKKILFPLEKPALKGGGGRGLGLVVFKWDPQFHPNN